MEYAEIQTTTKKGRVHARWNSQMTAGDTQTDKVQINRSVSDRKFRGSQRHTGGAPNSTWRVRDLLSPPER